MSVLSIPQGLGEGLHLVPYTVFPNAGMRILSATIHFIGSSALAYCVARRVRMIRMTSVNDFQLLSWPRFCVVMTLVISWIFVTGTGILIHGVGLSSSQDACSWSIFMCIWLYALTKLLIYAFLSEKVRVVWDVIAQPRLKSPVYLLCLLVMLPFGAMPILMIVGRIAFLRSTDMACIIGLKPFSSIPLLSYDVFTNVFLNTMFLWPLLRFKLVNSHLRAVARRNLVAAAASLATSITNLAILMVLRHELGWVCLGSCTADVTFNALAIFWVTMPTKDTFPAEPSAQLGRLPGQQQSTSESKPDNEQMGPKIVSVKNLIVIFAPPAAQKLRSSLSNTAHSKIVDAKVPRRPRTAENHELQYTPTFHDFPVSPTVASTSVGNTSMLTSSPGDEPNSGRRSTGLRSLGEFFGLSKQKPEHDMGVHVSVVTQHDVELGDLGSERTKQDDGDSLDQTKPASEWYK
ncbi:unnamed protein product [Rhizoctonia solani]|uniref:Transmembrane protein n=1 Tax=Rhizoctonia solani TaxID=456999 RepID=A0A8H2ZYJ9_9AGAM|nr:unnamed protein product [Rhizoctonia solani]